MDVLDEGKLHSQVLDPAITRLNTETIPALQAALTMLLDGALNQVATLASGVNENARAALATATVDLQATIAGLDGWHLTITPQGPIFAITGAIVIELQAPKKEQQS